MDRFHAPVAIHELDGQPVQQILVRRHFALEPEILNGANDPTAEEGRPLPIDRRITDRDNTLRG